MNQQAHFILSVAGLLALLSISALAQDQDEMKKKVVAEKIAVEMDAQFKGEMFKVMMPRFGFEMKVVKGAPYSATIESGTVQMLTDGNRISNKTTTTVYRDGEGRTRREAGANAQGVATEVFISDPVAGVNYVLETQRRVANMSRVNLPDLDAMKMKMAREQELMKVVRDKEMMRVQEDRPALNEGMPVKKAKPVTESLGKQTIEGVECEGTRTTVTIPAGKIGNDLPINIVSEEWYSPELQVLVLTKQNDPRTGETTYRLSNINRGEPDRALFEVPSDYGVLYEPKADKVDIKATLKKKEPGKPEEERQ